MRQPDLPRRHEDTKADLHGRTFVPSCLRGLLVLVGLLVVAHSLNAADAAASMIDHAVAIQVSLSHDKMDGVAANATGLSSDAASLGKPAEKIVAGAMALQKAKTIAEARDAFGKMSDALVAHLDAQKRKPANGVRVAYCPMARKPWLQKGEAIQNPYYGSQMLGCGDFKQ